MAYIFSDFPRYDIAENKLDQGVSYHGNPYADLSLILRNDDYSEPTKVLLQNILKAIGFELENCGLYQLDPDTRINCSGELFQKTKYILAFGLHPKDLSIHAQCALDVPFQIGGKNYILTSALSDMEADTEKKKKFWGSLKQLF